MSRMKEPPRRPFFNFENPFRKVSPKSSQSTPTSKLEARVNEFEEKLSDRLRSLIPGSKDDILSLSWMVLAVHSLCESHIDIKILIEKLELPPSDWDEKWIDVYFDISVKLLDICNAFTSELSRLNQGSLLVKCFLHKLDLASSSKGAIFPDSWLDRFNGHFSSASCRADNFCTILDSLVGSLDLPKVKNSTKGKLLIRAMYGVKVETVFVCSVFASAFSGNAKMLLNLNVAETFKWSQTFSDLQTRVNGEIRTIYSSGRFTPLKELEAVNTCVKELYQMIQDSAEVKEAKDFHNTVSELGGRVDGFSRGLDLLTKEVDGFFYVVLGGRDTLLSSLRSSERM